MAMNYTVEGPVGGCAFLAFSLNASLTLPTASWTTMSTATEIFDSGADLTTGTNSLFTAPVAGKYHFSLYIRLSYVDSGSDYYYTQLWTANRVYERVVDTNNMSLSGDIGYYAMPGVSCVADMDQGDTAAPKAYQAGGTVQSVFHSNGFWSGHLCA